MNLVATRNNGISARELINTMDSTQTAQKFRAKPEIREEVKEPIDWVERNRLKFNLFKKAILCLLITIFTSVLFVIAPLWAGDPVLGRTLLLSIPPMLFVTLTWMIPAWKFFDKGWLLPTMTMGLMPIRILVALGFSHVICGSIPEISSTTLFVGMMFHWCIFFISEAWLMWSLSNLKRTAEEEPRQIF